VKGHVADLRSASDEFNGHCLALTLMGSYLTDAHDGDIRCREEVSNRLTQGTTHYSDNLIGSLGLSCVRARKHLRDVR
jgi:hypothetical protein